MQVKKFEARSMKEALEMVKTQLGPDAIILSVRDNNKSFGLVGEGSVEVTAAVSDETLQKKKFTEAKFREQDLRKFHQSPAKQQREVIDKVVNKHMQKNQTFPITQRRYIEIEDEFEAAQVRAAEERIKSAAKNAWSAFRSVNTKAEEKMRKEAIAQQMQNNAANYEQQTRPQLAAESAVIDALKNEIESLRKAIATMQAPQQNAQATYPGSDYDLSYDLSYMFEKLTGQGVAPELAADICERAEKALPGAKRKNHAVIDGWVARYLLENTKVVIGHKNPKVQCFMGPAGSGKKASMVKMASHLVIRENKKVALLTTDTYKVGAADQLKIYAQILNVPFAVIRSQVEWNNLMKYLNNVDVVLVDFPGLNLKTHEEVQRIKNVLPPQSLNYRTHLVLSAGVKDSDSLETGRRYSVFNYQDVIFTGLDEFTQHGSIYNFMKRFDIPLHSFGIGPRVPEDFEFATKERLLDLLFKITQTKSAEVAI